MMRVMLSNIQLPVCVGELEKRIEEFRNDAGCDCYSG